MTTPSSRIHDCNAFCRPPSHEEARKLPEYGYLQRGEAEPSTAWLVTWEEVTA